MSKFSSCCRQNIFSQCTLFSMRVLFHFVLVRFVVLLFQSEFIQCTFLSTPWGPFSTFLIRFFFYPVLMHFFSLSDFTLFLSDSVFMCFYFNMCLCIISILCLSASFPFWFYTLLFPFSFPFCEYLFLFNSVFVDFISTMFYASCDTVFFSSF